jgi:hypothetical protein
MALNMRPSGLILEKKQILSWYETTPVYIILVLFSLGTLIFALTGLGVAREIPGFEKYVWAPRLLLGLSAVLIATVGFRLLKRAFVKYR